ncbi:MAG: CusA/CzcA family heavy metal efflux RND transporter, partial [Cytophagaceae bacterium]
LKTLLYSPDPLDAADQALPKLTLPYSSDSLQRTPPGSAQSNQHPQVRLLQQQIRVAEQTRLVEQARLRPDFLVGLFSQTLIGNQLIDGQEIYFGPGSRFTGGQLGITLPLLGKAQKARVEAAKVGEQLAQAELQTGQFALNQQLQQAVSQYDQYRNALTYYEQNGLSQAQLIQTNARRSFRGGDIGYVEFSLALQQSLTIRSSYLDLLNQYNQSILYITYLLGNP